MARVELVQVERKLLTFKVACSDDAGPIGAGIHQRAIIDAQRFEERLATKAATA